MAKRPNKKELARIKVLSDLGESASSIAKRMGRSHHTIGKYLKTDVFLDPTIQEILTTIKEKELSDLHLLGAKARGTLHRLLDEAQSG